jgi:hypothetical protein
MPCDDNLLPLFDQIKELGELSFRCVDAHGHNLSLVFFFSPIKAVRPHETSIPKWLAVWILAQPALCVFERIARFVNPRSVLLG